jgi:hypothetical protein
MARLEFGSVERYKEEARQARGLRIFDDCRADLRYAVRQFRTNKTFTFVTVLMLAVGIGANTAAFHQLNDAILKPLPVSNPEELRQVWYSAENDGFRTGGNAYQSPDSIHSTSFSYPAYLFLRDRTTAFTDIFCFSGPQTVNVGVAGGAESAIALLVSGNYFRTLGIQAALGRALTPGDDQAGEAAAVAILSHGFWQRAFGADPDAVGQTIVVNGSPVRVVGVMPRGFQAVNPDWRPDILLPMAMQSVVTGGQDVLKRPGYWNFLIFGRLRPDESEERARAETESLIRQAILAEPPDRPYDAPRITLAPAARGFRSRDAVSPAVLSTSVAVLILLINRTNRLVARPVRPGVGRVRAAAATPAPGGNRRGLGVESAVAGLVA